MPQARNHSFRLGKPSQKPAGGRSHTHSDEEVGLLTDGRFSLGKRFFAAAGCKMCERGSGLNCEHLRILWAQPHGALGVFQRRFGLTRMALHAERLRLVHPVSGLPLEISAPLPAELESVWSALLAAQEAAAPTAINQS